MNNEIREREDGSFEFTSHDDFIFETGESINPLLLVYETYGTLNTDKSNAVIVHHALSTSSHLASHEKKPEPGWWEEMVGPGRALDTDRYFIICVNNLGSCYGSSGPASLNPQTGKIYGPDFPPVTIIDMVRSQKRLVDELGISQLHAVLGSSMGAMLSIAWLVLYPDHARYLLSISSCAKGYPANHANRLIQKEIICQDPDWNNGRYSDASRLKGFKTARKHGLLTYRNWKELDARFVDKQGVEAIDNYLDYNAQKFIDRFDCNSYLRLVDAMDTFDLTEAGKRNLAEVFRPIQAKVLVVSVDSDVLFTPPQQQDLYRALRDAGVDVTYIDHHSSYGHDAFLVETDAFGEYIRGFIGVA
ncbi:MAG: homoserine O-acetyltransferase [Pseudomonadales bacterium]